MVKNTTETTPHPQHITIRLSAGEWKGNGVDVLRGPKYGWVKIHYDGNGLVSSVEEFNPVKESEE